MIVDKYANYVRKFMWQLCGWGRVDISMTFHKRAFDFLRTTALEKLVYILVTMIETSILHLAGGYVTLQARRAVNQSKKPANGKFVYRDNLLT
jgi:hypothetical protein